MERLGAFIVQKQIARGGMGVVYRGLHEVQQLPVALKVLLGEQGPDHLRDFRNEVRAAARLDHPNIVRVLDMGIHQTNPWLAMRLVEGPPLNESDWHSSWGSVRGVLFALLDALAHAHARGVIHRDIKPANVLLAPSGKVVLTDFGIAHAMGESGRTDLGTPAFMAPEQLTGRLREQGPATDLYALGCLAWRGVTHRNPFEGSISQVVAAQIRSPPPDFEPVFPVPQGFEEWLRRLLAKDPHARYAFAADAAWALSRLPDAPQSTGQVPTPHDPGQEYTTLVLDPGLLVDRIPSDAVPKKGDAAPMPRSWRRPERLVEHHLMGVGLGVFGLRTTPMVGRDEAAETIWRLLHQVRDHGGVSVCLVHGVAGVGRSRLLSEMASRGHEVGAAHTVQLSVDRADGRGLGQLVARMLGLEGLGGHQLLDEVSERVRPLGMDSWRCEALAEMVEPRGRVRFHEPEERFAVVRHLLRNRDRPTFIALDDVAGDPDLLAFVQWLNERGIDGPGVLVVMAHRPTSTGHPPDALIGLKPLEGEHRSQLVRSLLGLSGALATQVEDRTGGNPMFAVELVGDWVRRGLLQASREGFQLPKGEVPTIPDGPHAVWGARVAALAGELGSSAVAGLEAAAVLGHEFERQLYLSVCEKLGEHGDGVLAALAEDQLLVEGTNTLSFTHSMFVESILRHCREQGRWQGLNAVCADVVAQTSVDRKDERLGQHLMAAGRTSEARVPLLRAIETWNTAGEVPRVQNLLDLFEQSLADAAPDDPDWGELLHWKSRVARNLGHLEQARNAAQELLDRGTEHRWPNTPLALADLAEVGLAAGDLTQAVQHLERCLGLVPPDSDIAIRCRLSLAGAAHLAGNMEEATTRYKACRDELMARSGMEVSLGSALLILCDLSRIAGDLKQAQVWCSEAASVYESIGYVRGMARVCNSRGIVSYLMGDLEGALELFGEAQELADAVGHDLVVAMARHSVGEIYWRQGLSKEAEAAFREAVRVYGSHNLDRFGAQLGLAQIWLVRGDHEGARVLLTEILQQTEGHQGWWRILAHVLLVVCAADWRLHGQNAETLIHETGFTDPDFAAGLEDGIRETTGDRRQVVERLQAMLRGL